jgi:DNA-binding NarL/FixJ family response regulator
MPDRPNSGVTPIRVLIAEDEALLRSAVAELLQQAGGKAVLVVRTCATRAQALRDTRALQPDVILLDLRMPDTEGRPSTLAGSETVAALLRQHAAAKVICLSVHAEAEIVRACLEAGAKGFLGKGVLPAEIWTAIRIVAAGGQYIEPPLRARLDLLAAGSEAAVRAELLAGRRGDVLRLLLDGYSPSEIAKALPISKKYVDKKVAEIKSILGVSTTIRIYRICRQLGIVDE